jgi:hypothetical protein
MNKGLAAIGFSALALSLMIAPASARIITYEINGKYYTYDSTKPQEIAVARKRIEAANAADQAKADAAAERVRNPFTAIFGSKLQDAARAAQAHLERVMAEDPQVPRHAAARTAPPSPRAEPAPKSAATKPESAATKPESAPTTPESAATAPLRQEPAKEDDTTRAAAAESKPIDRDEAVADRPVEPSTPEVQSVYLDTRTGIRTVFMADGSVREELVEETVGKTNEVVRRQPDDGAETTGSTKQRTTGPAR